MEKPLQMSPSDRPVKPRGPFHRLPGKLAARTALLLLLMAIFAGAARGAVPDSVELRVLTELFHGTGGPGWVNKANWLVGSTSADFATWHGVTVTNGDVTRIELPDNGLSGQMPASLGELAMLRNLYLFGNALSGPIPRELGNLADLRDLRLYDNNLSGPVPPQLGQLSNLRQLYLNDNALSGPIPAELGQLGQLRYLFLSNNDLTGPLPSELGALSSLLELLLHGNRLSGTIPPQLGNLTALRRLRLYNNLLTGAVPGELGQLPVLENLYLHNNQLESLPDLSGHPNRAGLAIWAQGNRLDFGSLEPNMTGAGTHGFATFTYGSQAELGEATGRAFAAGQLLELRAGAGGTRNLYQWQRQVNGAWQNIAGATQSAYTVPSATAADAGVYRCRITNGWATGLTLYTAPLTVSLSQDEPLASMPSQEMNYVLTRTAQVEGLKEPAHLAVATTGQVQESITYFDGLGRALQTVLTKASPTHRDLVTPVSYDAFGRMEKSYLSYAATGAAGSYRASGTDEQASFYDPQSVAFPDVAKSGAPWAVPVYEASPLNRVLEQGAPGVAWQPASGGLSGAGHTVKFTYRANRAGEVRRWDVDPATGAFSSPGFYPAGTLYVTQTSDEEDALTVEYKDLEGRVVTRKVQEADAVTDVGAEAGFMLTHYVYDELGHLRLVIQPEGSRRLPAAGTVTLTGDFLSDWCFSYAYDGRRRVVEKRVPGSGVVELVYNGRDEVVLTRDANQAGRGVWAFTKHDALGRVLMTGEVAEARDRLALQAAAEAYNGQAGRAQHEKRTRPGESGHTELGYTLEEAFPAVAAADLLAVTFYDDYAYGYLAGYGFSGTALAGLADKNERVTGQVTGTRTRVLGTGDWLVSVNYYDEKYRVIQTVSDGYVGGTRQAKSERLSTRYDFAGRPLETLASHQSGQRTVRERMAYDHQGRLNQARQSLDGRDEVLLALNAYNELGQVTDKGLHSTDYDPAAGQGAFLQSVDYRYNIRGWLTSINNASLTVDASNDEAGDLFGLELCYECGFELRYYNGNISGVRWQSALDGVERAYGYRYDKAGRLLQADYRALDRLTGQWAAEQEGGMGRYDLWGLSYDANGNIRSLARRGLVAGDAYDRQDPARAWGTVDDLRYRYQGNRLVNVRDLATGPMPDPARAVDFRDNGHTGEATDEYAYDAMGNLTSDMNKGITSINYNHLHLPQRVEVQGKGHITYTYAADGTKLRKQVHPATGPVTSTDYAGAFIYENDTLRFAFTPEGRALYEPQTTEKWRYEYHLKDHLGNLRVSFAEPVTTSSELTMEPAMASSEEAEFDRVQETRHLDHVRARTGSHAALLSAGRNRPLGPAKRVELQRGDTLRVKAFGMYETERKQELVFSLASWLASAAVLSAGLPGPGEQGGGRKGKALPYLGAGLALAPQVVQKEKGAPKAYLRYIAYDSDSNYVASGYRALTGKANKGWEELELEFAAQQDGFAEVYLANESAEEAWFDDMSVTVTAPMLVQENHYDPWGLNLAGIEKQGAPDHRFQYNGKERQTELGLNWYDYGARMYAPDIARWNGVDASAENYVNQSPYHYVGNNPIKFVDFDGNDYGVKVDRGNKTITIKAHFLTSAKSSTAFKENGSGRWNAQSGKNVFVAGGLKALRQGKADVYSINIDISSEVSGGADGQGRYISDRDQQVSQDQTGIVNSFDVEKDGFVENQGGGALDNQIDMKSGKEGSSITTHEVNHTMGIAHTGDGGTQSPSGGGSVKPNQIAETLKGVGIGGDNISRNSNTSIGNGRLLNNSSNQGLEQGKVISLNRYARIVRRLERKENRQN